ncbi:MAG: GspE/PulE family protein [Smithellaceae bacterium]|jgi:type II secretory ATPase GspE/PulE/Tfp pilus assembly ATPase PilB-like protein
MSLLKILKDKYELKEDDLDKALQLQKDLGGDIGRILVQTGLITEAQLVEALSGYLKIPLFEGDWEEDEEVQAYLTERLNYDFLVKSNFLPIKIDHEEKKLYAATCDPFNYAVSDYVANNIGYSLKLFLATEQTIKELSKNYNYESVKDFVSLNVAEDAEKLKEMAFDAPVIKFLNNLLSKAVELRASDIHIESSEKKFKIRYRIDGILQNMGNLDESFYLAVVSRIKLLSGLDIAEKRLSQDGKFTTKIASLLLDLRVSTIPMVSGEGVVLRLLYREKLSFDLEVLGLEADHKDILLKIISQPYGILLVTGPTGSGKSTTLYSMLKRLNNEERKIITIEDPVEYQLEGINQIQVKDEIGMSFANALRSILRHDPDIIMVGEIRDKETAAISIQSALTGHLVFSTLHTNDAPSSLFRLIEMGVEDYLINSAVIGLLAQRILRKNCPFCSEPAHLSENTIKEYQIREIAEKNSALIHGGITFTRGKGCSRCAKTGYRGRIAVFELLEYTDELKEVFLKKMSLEALREVLLKNKSYRLLREDGMLKVAKGLTTLEEVLRVC